MKEELKTDTPYIHNDALPIWIVPVSGWGSDGIDEAHTRMLTYKNAAQAFRINIEFSSRLGTFQSYKNAPSVAKEISEHNEKTFAAYEDVIGADWRKNFNEKVQQELNN